MIQSEPTRFPTQLRRASIQRSYIRDTGVGVALWVAGVLALELSLGLALLTRMALDAWKPIGIDITPYSMFALDLMFIPLGYALFGLFPGYGLNPVERMRRLVLATVVAFLSITALMYATGEVEKSRGVILLTPFFAVFLVPLFDALARTVLIDMGRWGMPVVLIGAGVTGARVAAALKRDSYLGLIPVAFLDENPDKHHQTIEGVPVLGNTQLAPQMARLGIREALITQHDLQRNHLMEMVYTLPFPNVIVVPDLYNPVIMWSVVRDVGRVSGLEVRKNLLLPENRLVKKILDLVLAWPLFLFSLPLIGLLALCVKLVSPGLAFFAQEREGQGGKPIKVLKLRTMYPDAKERLEKYLAENPEAKKEWERSYKLRNDPRILPYIGKFLRRTSLDELPQLFNVIRGEMSLVGPRPFPAYHLEQFPPEFRKLRHSVIPGLTGFWQVSARSNSDLQVQEALDTYYIRNWSPWLDIYLLFRTISTVLKGSGAY